MPNNFRALEKSLATATTLLTRFCREQAQIFQQIAEMPGWTVRGVLPNGLHLAVDVGPGFTASSENGPVFELDLYSHAGQRVGWIDQGSLEQQLMIARDLSLDALAHLYQGLRHPDLPHQVWIDPHTVLTARSSDRLEITNAGDGQEHVTIADFRDAYRLGGRTQSLTLTTGQLLELRDLINARFGKQSGAIDPF